MLQVMHVEHKRGSAVPFEGHTDAHRVGVVAVHHGRWLKAQCLDHLALESTDSTVGAERAAVWNLTHSVPHDSNTADVLAQGVLFFSVKGMDGHLVPACFIHTAWRKTRGSGEQALVTTIATRTMGPPQRFV